MKATKRTLLGSSVALLICFAMLLGTTYAWFTDSVTSSGNIIKTGTLDVSLKSKTLTDTNWQDASEGSIFNYTNWEPGYTEARYVKIENEGSLAFKYVLNIIPTEAAGEVDLADVIDVYLIEGEVEVTREALANIAPVGTLASLIANGATNGELVKDTERVFTLVLKMQENAGNEYQDLTVGGSFAVQLLATQLARESDDIDSNYDANAEYDAHVSNAADLAEAIADGGVTVLMNDIDLSAIATYSRAANDVTLTIPAGVDAVIDLNGYKLTASSVQTGKNYNMIDVRGSLTVKNGTVTTQHFGTNMGWSNSTNVFNVTAGGVLNLDNVKAVNLGGSDMGFVAHLNNWGEVTLNVNNSELVSNYCAVRVFNSGYDMNNVNITNSTLTGGSTAVWVHNYTAEDFGSQEKADAQAALLNFNFINVKTGALNTSANNVFNSVIRFGFTNSTRYTTSDLAVVDTAEELAAALEAGEKVLLVASLYDCPVTTTAPYGNKLGVSQKGGELDGQGYVLDFDMPTGDHYGIMTNGGTIKNLTVGGVFRGIVIMSPVEDVIIDNVVIDDKDVCYAINTTEGGPNGVEGIDLIVTNSTLCGWTSVGDAAIDTATFTNCTFGQGTYYNNVYGRLVKPYVDTVFEGCEFISQAYLDLSSLKAGDKVVLRGCTVNGVLLTNDNIAELIAPESTCGEGQMSIESRTGTYLTADNWADYVIIE